MGGFDWSNLNGYKKPVEATAKKAVARHINIPTDNYLNDILFSGNEECRQIYEAYNSSASEKERR